MKDFNSLIARLSSLSKGKKCAGDFSNDEWDEYISVHRELMQSATLWLENNEEGNFSDT